MTVHQLSPRQIQSHSMLGMRLDYMSWRDGVTQVIDLAASGISAYCCVPDASQCVLCYDDPSHMAIVNGADLVLTDSMILQKMMAFVHSIKAPLTVKGADLMAGLCEAAAERDMPIALIGGRDDKVLGDLKSALEGRFPTLRIGYAFSPPFRQLSETEDDEMVRALSDSGARLIFVGLGCPKQERWMAQHKGSVNAMMIGVGAAFDFISGAVKPSPAWVHKNGLEWLYRLTREPKRLWRRYLLTCPRLLWLLLLTRFRERA
jgi:N-acetylglucosaminyldiphosphoundecaprenol N-acetyl-beta-D-mannosaminyltransferase